MISILFQYSVKYFEFCYILKKNKNSLNLSSEYEYLSDHSIFMLEKSIP